MSLKNMKRKLLVSTLLIMLGFAGFSQEQKSWDNWSWLIGEWQGEGSGQPGQGGGTFSFGFDLDKNILVRKSHSEYLDGNTNSTVVHNDLMIVYPENEGQQAKAIYFDNEGHIISYSIKVDAKAITLTSEKLPNMPVFRLTYLLLDNDMVDTKFEMSQDGEQFMTYVEGKSRKINSSGK